MKSLVTYNVPALSTWSDKLVPKLNDREYRHAYMEEGVKTWIARQVRALREQRDWSQGDLARESSKKQSAISRIEDPDYGQLTLQTLFDLAKAYDLPLLVQFVDWQDWLYRMEDVSTESLKKSSFDADHLAAISNQQYVATNASLLTNYGIDSVVNSIALVDLDAASAENIARTYRFFNWDTEDEVGDVDFDTDWEKFEAKQTWLTDNAMSWDASAPQIAGLIKHG
jgi:transcriptional regulator with XRE-family HTH domain